MILKLKYRASRMGANLLKLILDERSEHKKLMSEANSELLLIFFKVTTRLAIKLPLESSESEIQ